MSQESGFLVLDKPSGVTSHDLVAAVRRRLKIRQVGHAGTLDPMATGVLVIGIGDATKFLQHIVAGKKRYLATIQLGVSTTTDDREGEITEQSDTSHITDAEITTELAKFIGEIEQVPSSVSAIKVGGKRAYELVRAGESVELKARKVEIHSLEILAIQRDGKLTIDIAVTCSAGTYIRAIARDLGAGLKVGGHLISLRRTLVDPFDIEMANSVDKAPIIPLAKAVQQLMPFRIVSDEEVRELRFGRRIGANSFVGIGAAIDEGGNVVAILENQEGKAQPLSVFMKE